MDFSSVPFYLDPANWQQQQQDHHQHGSSSENPQLLPPPPPPGGTGSIRPGSMAERARLAKVPQPETAMKCPRCDSNNTKFCYFNNYSLTQPRHFCKTCRRYWTRGGALRNVPVGGGCRRNKKSKSSSSKSPVTGDRQGGSCSGSASASASTSAILSNSCTYDMMYHMPSSQAQQLPSLSSLHHLTDYTSNDIGLNFVGLQSPVEATTGIVGGSAESADQWRIPQVHQFPFMAGLEPPQGLYAFDGENMEHGYATGVGQIPARPSGSGISRFASVKMEDNHGLNLSRQFLGIPGNDQYWSGGGNAWTDLSGFTSSSTSNLS